MRTGRVRRIAALLALFGIVQTLAPTLLRHVRPSLSVSIRFRVSTDHSELGVVPATVTSETPASDSEANGETSGESSDATDLLKLEGLTWLEGTAPSHLTRGPYPLAHAGPPLRTPAASNGSIRDRWQSWRLEASRTEPPPLTAQLCRFLC